ncbi:YopR/YscH family type III secretion effector [Vibrio sagamiensis]|uniref:Type III export protein n=1 Tax=Vibrio sagamiensis NBRC 104589 TaxID=1219064 RepID=A0A511QDQ2_9VIBR|nr:YopR/YscH family type III secretion effector [Vibrio sagamiensis]PNQ56779.1 type III export protein [Vibrio agarivorans]GEM75434.1 type III export protein [Vibrio sagamiensis NBRC 104589]
MKVEGQGNIVNPMQKNRQLSYEQQDVDRMNSLMVRNKNIAVSHSTISAGHESVSTRSKYIKVKEWYEEIKQSGNFDLSSLKHSLNTIFRNNNDVKDALWYSYNQEMALKGTSEASPALFDVLEEELLGTFTASIIADVPNTREELKARLTDFYNLGAHKEKALFHTWAELKSQADMSTTVDIIRSELGHVITMNGLARNILTHSHKLDLD